MKWIYFTVKVSVLWVLLACAVYATYFASYNKERIKDGAVPELDRALFSFRLACSGLLPEDNRCWDRVEFYWADSWRPPAWLWRSGRVTPFVGCAPFFFIPFMPQYILLDREYWASDSEEERRSTVFHELGHALLGWSHSENSKSLMFLYGPEGVSLFEAFRIATEENK